MLRLLSDRRDDLVRARTQTLNRLHVLLADLVPDGAGRNLDAKPQPPCCVGCGPRPRRPAPAGSSLSISSPTFTLGTGGSPQPRAASRWPSPGRRPPSPSCSESAPSWPPSCWARSATSDGSRPSTTSPPTPAPLRSRPPAARSSTTGCPGSATAGSTTPCPGRDRADPPPHHRAGLLPAQAGRGQVPQGSPALPQAPVVRRRLPPAPGRPAPAPSGPALTTEEPFSVLAPARRMRETPVASPGACRADVTLVAACAHRMPPRMWARKRGSDQLALVWPSAVYQERPRPC
jgi:hypothetical protein